MRKEKPVDVHQVITDTIIAAIENGCGDRPSMPWQRSGLPTIIPTNVHSKNRYQGINIPALWAAAEIKQYPLSLWGTYKQWADAGAQVRKGERGSVVAFYKDYDVTPAADNPDDNGKRFVARHSYVWNVAQVDGYALADPPPALEPIAINENASRYLDATGIETRIGGERAYYVPSQDYVQMPSQDLFRNPDPTGRTSDWLSVLCHEIGHSTGAKHRLNRDFSGRFGDESYAFEELCAEIFSAFKCADLGISIMPRDDHAKYIAHWLKILKDDKRAIFTAAARASEAVRYLDAIVAAKAHPAIAA